MVACSEAGCLVNRQRRPHWRAARRPPRMGEGSMTNINRRTLLKAAAGAGAVAASGGLCAPALAQGAAGRTLRFVPQANLANFDPVWGTQYVVRNAAVLVWDTLYGIDDK